VSSPPTPQPVLLRYLSSEQITNLSRLAAYLASLPEDYVGFDMSAYHTGYLPAMYYCGGVPLRPAGGGQQYCGTAACALGHGPAAGVAVPSHLLCTTPAGETRVMWTQYSRLFCWETAAYNWLFSGSWTHLDNTPRGAAGRLRYALAGLPLPLVLMSADPVRYLRWREEPDLYALFASSGGGTEARQLLASYAPYLPPPAQRPCVTRHGQE